MVVSSSGGWVSGNWECRDRAISKLGPERVSAVQSCQFLRLGFDIDQYAHSGGEGCVADLTVRQQG